MILRIHQCIPHCNQPCHTYIYRYNSAIEKIIYYIETSRMRNLHQHLLCFEDVYLPGEFKNLNTSINAVSLEQYDEDYIRINAKLETRPPIRSREELQQTSIHGGWMTLASSRFKKKSY